MAPIIIIMTFLGVCQLPTWMVGWLDSSPDKILVGSSLDNLIWIASDVWNAYFLVLLRKGNKVVYVQLCKGKKSLQKSLAKSHFLAVESSLCTAAQEHLSRSFLLFWVCKQAKFMYTLHGMFRKAKVQVIRCFQRSNTSTHAHVN